MRFSKSWRERLRMIFGKPMHFNESARKKAEAIFRIRHFNHGTSSQSLNRYVLYQVGATSLFLFLLIGYENYLNLGQQLLAGLAVLITLINIGAILEQKRWIYYLEYFRAVALVFLILTVAPNIYLIALLVVLALFFSIRFNGTREKYLQLVYREH